MRLISVLFLGVWFGILGCEPSSAGEQTVRVLVAENQPSFTLSVRGRYTVRAWPSMQILSKGESLSGLRVAASGADLIVGKHKVNARGIVVEPERERDLYLNQGRFRGSLRVILVPNQGLSAINVLGMEGYLYGVLHHEVAPWWPMDALKAQAIAARTYAYYQTLVNAAQEYDLKNTTSSQVYGGSTTERYRTRNAVNLTRGQILTFERKAFPAYFHATCGGKTAASDELWNIALPPLRGGVLCSYCKISPHFFWRRSVPLAQIEEVLRGHGQDVGRILRIEPISQTPSGRVGSVRITGTTRDYVIAAKDFRIWLGGDKLRSTRFLIQIVDDVAQFTGEGWGHGVGLCQWGALGQSLVGKSYKDILTFYYPDSAITDTEQVSPPAFPTSSRGARSK